MIAKLLPFIFILPPLAYALISLWCVNSYFGRRKATSGELLPVTILKPVKGVDAGSLDNFRSFCRQDHPCYQIVFAVASADDPVLPIIRQLMDEFPEQDIDLVIDARIYGPNYKVCNLINAFPKARHDILIVCDSDIRVDNNYLSEVVALFADPQVGLVTSLYRSSGVSGASVLEALGFTAEMIPNVMVALKLEGLSFALGASMAVRREALAAIGGFEALVDYLADDYQLGNKVHKAGYRLELSDCFVESVMHCESLATILSRQLRWSRTMRVSRTAGYLASGITQPFVGVLLSVFAGLALDSLGYAFWATCILYCIRSIVVMTFSRRYVKDGLLPRFIWLLPLRDLFSFMTWVLAFTGNRVTWRGHRYVVRPGGLMQEVGR
jgi:ceramide glucosyltransferase